MIEKLEELKIPLPVTNKKKPPLKSVFVEKLTEYLKANPLYATNLGVTFSFASSLREPKAIPKSTEIIPSVAPPLQENLPATEPNMPVASVTARVESEISDRRRDCLPSAKFGEIYPCACGCEQSYSESMKPCRGCRAVYVNTHCVSSWMCFSCQEDLDDSLDD